MGDVAYGERDLVIARALIDARAGVEHGALEAGLAEQPGDALGLLRLEAREQLGGRLKQQGGDVGVGERQDVPQAADQGHTGGADRGHDQARRTAAGLMYGRLHAPRCELPLHSIHASDNYRSISDTSSRSSASISTVYSRGLHPRERGRCAVTRVW